MRKVLHSRANAVITMDVASLLLYRGFGRWWERRYREAVTDLQEALNTYQTLDSYIGKVNALAYLALARAGEGANNEAEQHLADAVDRAGVNPHQTISALLTVVEAYIFCCVGEYARSAALCAMLGDGASLSYLQHHAILLPTRQRAHECLSRG